MATLNEQIRDIVSNYNALHLFEVNRLKPKIAPYLKLAINDQLVPDKFELDNVGDSLYFIQIKELEKLLESAREEEQEKKEEIENLIQQLKEHNDKERLKVNTQFIKIDEIVNDTPLLSEVMGEYAKIQEVERRLKDRAYVEYNHEAYKGKIADDLGYVLKKAKNNEVQPQEVQKTMDSISFRPSMTAHPTNPFDHEFTILSMKIADDIINGSERIEGRIAELVSKDPCNLNKKTQIDEIKEGLAYLNAFYDSVDREYEILQAAIDDSDYKGQITLPDNINQPNVWLSGDGDGNTNATRESLEANIEMFRKDIKAKYSHELQNLKFDKEFDLENSENPQDLIAFLKEKHEELLPHDTEKAKKVQSLIRKVSSFGYHFAKIDIRHTAVDLAKIDEVIAKLAKNETPILRYKKDYPEPDDKSIRKELVNKIIFEEGFLDSIYPEGKEGANQMIIRLLGRFELAAQHPEMFDKAIIAEFNEPSQIQAVLRILKNTGHVVSGLGATLNITPLAESKENLEKFHTDVVTAMDDQDYMAHLRATKKIYFMIARSDTVRRNGSGAQFSQEKAIRETTAAIMEKLLNDPSIPGDELAEYEITPYSGGGAALQRGGGRMIELPSVYGRYCLESIQDLIEKYCDQPEKLERIKKMIPREPFLTTQGHQNGLMYNNGSENLAAFYSQGVYARLKLEDKIPDSEKDILALRQYYENQVVGILGDIDDLDNNAIVGSLKAKGHNSLANKFDAAFKDDLREQTFAFAKALDYNINNVIDNLSERCVAIYARDVGSEDQDKPSPIDKLLANGPWLFTKRGNKSSRPSKRGVADGGEEIETVAQALGLKDGVEKAESLRILKQRAIGVESLSSHSGTNVISWLGWSEAIRNFQADNPNIDLTELFHISKSFRDLVRSAEMSIRAANFDKAWEMLCPDHEIPNDEGRQELHASYMNKMNAGQEEEIENHETLAYIQEEAIQSVKIFEKIAGHELSPNAHKEIEFNRESISTASKIQRGLTRFLNDNPDTSVTSSLQNIIDPVYASIDAGAAKSSHLMEPQRRRNVEQKIDIPLVKKVKTALERVKSRKMPGSSPDPQDSAKVQLSYKEQYALD